MQINSTYLLAWNFAFFQVRIATIQKCVVRLHILLYCNVMYCYGTQNILLTHASVCWFTVLVLVNTAEQKKLCLYTGSSFPIRYINFKINFNFGLGLGTCSHHWA